MRRLVNKGRINHYLTLISCNKHLSHSHSFQRIKGKTTSQGVRQETNLTIITQWHNNIIYHTRFFFKILILFRYSLVCLIKIPDIMLHLFFLLFLTHYIWRFTNVDIFNSSSLLLTPCMCMMGSVLTHLVVSDSLRSHGLQPTRFLCPWDLPGKNTKVGCHSLLQGIFLTQGSNPSLLHFLPWQVDSLLLSHQECSAL